MYRVTKDRRVILQAATLALIEEGLARLPDSRYGLTGPDTDCWCTVRYGVPVFTCGICEGRAVQRLSPDNEWRYQLRQIMAFLPIAAIDFIDDSVIFTSPTKHLQNKLVNVAVWLKAYARWDVARIEPTLLEVKKPDSPIPLPRLHELHRAFSGHERQNLVLFLCMLK